ncbi:MAG: FHA domain-containing protein [Candidatus Aminicenantes bacterium]|nr:FHA domain-containing protein [Candidatus Aminicenantes bacterium]
MLINKYDPRLKKLAELEQTFACGEKILDELAAELKPGKDNQLSRQSWIITGARGAGKSHLLTLLYHRVKNDETLSRYWWPVIFPEELFGVDSLYRLLIQVFEHIFKGDGTSSILPEIKNEFSAIKKIRITGNLKQKSQTAHSLAGQLFDLLAKLKSVTNKSFILMWENLQYLLREQLSEDDVKHLRGFMSERQDVFIIIGTALTVFDEISDYGKPFYHFFRLRAMDNLERVEIVDFLLKLAAFRKDEGINGRVEKNRRYIYLYQLLTGGNPRLILFLYELLLGHENLDTYMILEKITELTPYFLDKTRDESGQRKLILDTLATGVPAQTAKEIAEGINEDYKSILEQLKRLSAEGWIKEISIDAVDVRKNEVFYALRDYFYRIWYKTRTRGIEESDILCMAELVVFLFDRKEIEERLLKLAGLNKETQALYEKSLELAADDFFMKNLNLLLKEAEKYEIEEVKNLLTKLQYFKNRKDWTNLIVTSEKILSYQVVKVFGYHYLTKAYQELGDVRQAKEYLKKTINEIEPDSYLKCFFLGYTYYQLTQYKESYWAFSECIKYYKVIEKGQERIYNFFLNNDLLKKIGHELFESSIELQHLLDKSSSPEIKFESLCRLLLLGKFLTVTDAFERLLEETNLPFEGSQKLEIFLKFAILDILKNQPQNTELKIFFKYWVHLVSRQYDEHNVRKIFMQFLFDHIVTAGKKNISLEAIKSMFNQLDEEGVEIPDVLLKINAAFKNPNHRESQQWMADPLFSQSVIQLLRDTVDIDDETFTHDDVFEKLVTENSIFRLSRVNGEGPDNIIITPGDVKIVGRSPDNDVILNSRTVSRFHARISYGKNGIIVEDLGTTNGTSVNNKKIFSKKLKLGDVVTFVGASSYELRLSLERM